MSGKSKLGRNLSYQTLYQVLQTVLPLITAPYLARVLGASQQGVYSYTHSIASYFTLFAMLGFSNHGTRSIAQCGDDIQKRSQTFVNIYALQLVSSGLSILTYVCYILFVQPENIDVATLQTIAVASCSVQVAWVFFGLERFRLTVLRNTVIRIAVVVCIMVFVKDADDLWIYALLMGGADLLAALTLFVLLPKVIRPCRPRWSGMKQHIKPVLLLFVPLLAMSVYHIMDKTMLGLLSDYENSGYYYNADKIINIPIGVISGISTVMLPRMASLLSRDSKKEFRHLFSMVMEGTILLAVALSFGIAAISWEFTPVFFGAGFDDVTPLTIALAPVMIIKAIAFTIRFQYLVPNHREKEYIISVVVGSVVNLVANWVLIPMLGAMGAVMGTLIAEGIACYVQILCIRKEMPVWRLLLRSLPYLVIGGIMFAAVRLMGSVLTCGNTIKLVAEVAVGIVTFTLVSLLYWRIAKTKTVINDLFLSFRKKH